MEPAYVHFHPKRVADLIDLKEKGADVACRIDFEVLPVDFTHRKNAFQAYIFLSGYSGTIDGKDYAFRKCYARGCPNNLCPHVSQAVMIANRYLQRDYQRLRQAGISVPEQLFTLPDMVLKFEDLKEEGRPALTIYDCLNRVGERSPVSVDIALEYVPAVEHFTGYRNAQTFLMVDFTVTSSEGTTRYERCLACYSTENEQAERSRMREVANKRLNRLYLDFDHRSVQYQKRYFQ